MKMKIGILAALALSLLSGLSAQGSGPAGSPRASTKLVIVRYIHDGSQTYEFNAVGIRKHFEDLPFRGADPALIEALRPLVQRLDGKTKQARATSLGIGIAGGALTLGCVGLGIVQAIKDDAAVDAWMAAGPNASGGLPVPYSIFWFGGASFLGVGTVLGATLPLALAGAKESDFLDYVNRYNLMNPANPIEVY